LRTFTGSACGAEACHFWRVADAHPTARAAQKRLRGLSVVTAERRNSNLQTAPIAVTMITGEGLTKTGC
jgi:hypothetical protein